MLTRMGLRHTIEDVQGKTGIPGERLEEFERGRIRPTEREIERLCRLYGLTPPQLAALAEDLGGPIDM
jgi:hypothetical protein